MSKHLLLLLAVGATFVLPATAGAQGRKLPVCDRSIFSRLTVDEAGTTVFGAPPGVPDSKAKPGRAIAVGETITVFGTGSVCQSGQGCPTGAVSVDCTARNPDSCAGRALPARAVYAWNGQSDGACRTGPPTGVSDAVPLGSCCVCTWRRRID